LLGGNSNKRVLQKNDPTDIAIETIAVIAERANVPPSALIRFAKAFSYKGFTEMQKTFQARVIQRSASYKERISASLSDDSDASVYEVGSLLNQFCEANIAALHEVSDSFNKSSLNDAFEILAGADQIFIMGQRRSYPIATYLAYSLGHADCHPVLLDGAGGMLQAQAEKMSKKDALIAISFPPYSEETSKIIDIAAEKQANIICMTDSRLNPNADKAQVCLEVHDADVLSFRSLSASMTLAQTLCTALASRDIRNK